MPRRRLLTVSALLVAIAPAVAGCGGKDGPRPIGRAALQRQFAGPLTARVPEAGDATARAQDDRHIARVAAVLLSVFGQKVGSKSGDLLRLQSAALVAYAAAQRSRDATAAMQALGDLQSTRNGVLDLLDGDFLPASRKPVSDALAREDQALTAMLRARAASSPLLAGRRRDAERAAADLARALATAAVQRHPELLGS